MNKIAFNLFLVFCGFLVVVAGLGITMMIAPGADILGVRYIRSTSGSVHETRSVYCLNSPVEEFNITCDNIPIEIRFVQSYTFSVELDEQYNGYTKTVETPDIAVDNSGNIVVFSVREYKPFVYHNRLSGSALKISIPIYYNGRVAVQSNTSDIVVDGMNGTLQNLVLTTGGSVSVHDITLPKLKLNVKSKSVTIEKGAKIDELNIDAVNAKIKIYEQIHGDIIYNAQGGGLYFSLCENLTVKAGSAQIGSVDDNMAYVSENTNIETNGKIKLDSNGDVKITTKNADISLGKETISYGGKIDITTQSGDVVINGRRSAEAKIKTKSGDIFAEDLDSFEITTEYGTVNINMCTEGTIQAGSGNVNVLGCKDNLVVNSRSGDLTFGNEESAFPASAEIVTLGGNVKFINATEGQLNVSTQSGDINFTGGMNNLATIKIESKKGDVNIDSFSGQAKIKTFGAVYMKVLSAQNGIEVVAKDKNVVIETEKDSKSSFDLMAGKSNKITVWGEKQKERNYLSALDANITISTKKGEIIIQDVAS